MQRRTTFRLGVMVIFLSFLATGKGQQANTTAFGTYVNAADQTEVLKLNPDYTFALHENGQDYAGKWQLTGTTLKIKLKHQTATATLVGQDTFVDSENKHWVRQVGKSTSASGSQTSVPPQSAVPPFTNANVIQLAKAGMPDEVIVQKIRTCGCQLDTSTEALIQLRQAGISTSVMTAMMGGAAPVAVSASVSSHEYEREPDFSSPYYNDRNEYHVNGYGGQCTWFAWGRAYERGFSIPFTNGKDGKQWHGDAFNWTDPRYLTMPTTDTPRADSIAVWNKNSVLKNGHVAYVESVEGDQVFYREANIKPCSDEASKKGGGYCGDGSVPNKGLRKHPLKWFMTRFGEAPKFIYLTRSTQTAATPILSSTSVSRGVAPIGAPVVTGQSNTRMAGAPSNPSVANRPIQLPSTPYAAACAYNGILYKLITSQPDIRIHHGESVRLLDLVFVSYPDDNARPRLVITISENHPDFLEMKGLFAGFDRVMLTCFNPKVVDQFATPPMAAYLAVEAKNPRPGVPY